MSRDFGRPAATGWFKQKYWEADSCRCFFRTCLQYWRNYIHIWFLVTPLFDELLYIEWMFFKKSICIYVYFVYFRIVIGRFSRLTDIPKSDTKRKEHQNSEVGLWPGLQTFGAKRCNAVLLVPASSYAYYMILLYTTILNISIWLNWFFS